MGLVHSKQDIANVLRSVASVEQEAERAYGLGNPQHREGFQAALVAIGLAFGLHRMIRQERKVGPVWLEVETDV